MSDIGERVKKIVVEHLGVEPDKVTENASFIDDLGADSLDTVELVMAFEEEFGCEIPDDAAETNSHRGRRGEIPRKERQELTACRRPADHPCRRRSSQRGRGREHRIAFVHCAGFAKAVGPGKCSPVGQHAGTK